MNHHDFADVTGTLTAPALPSHAKGAPRLFVTMKAGDTRLAYWSAQASHTPMAFRLIVGQDLSDHERVIEAKCTAGTGSAETIASCSQPLPAIDDQAIPPLHLVLKRVGDAPIAEAPADGKADVIELAGNVTIPEALFEKSGYVRFTALVIQADGGSNQYSSNIAEHSIYRLRPTLPFVFTLDRTTAPKGNRIKLSILLYDKDHKEVVGGKTIRDIDLGNLPNLSDIVLKARSD